jgi:ADP-ribose pyrophosphatase
MNSPVGICCLAAIFIEIQGGRDDLSEEFKEITIKSEPIFKGKVISLQVDEVRLPNGKTATREIVRHPGAVSVLALTEDRMLVVEQFRKPIERNQLEIPAGKLEPGEDPLEAAKRELQEETGYSCGTIRLISSFYTAPGFADEIMHLYATEQLTKGEMNPDEDEFISCRALTYEEACEGMRSGAIQDAKTIAAVYAWQSYRLTGSFLP